MTQKFWVILYRFSTPKTVRKVLIDRNHAGSGKSPLCSGASQFAADHAAVQLLVTGHSESILYAKE